MRIDSPYLVSTTVISGSLEVTGTVKPGGSSVYDLGSSDKLWRNVFSTGFSGSLTKLADGSSYLIAGNNIGIATGSNGSVTITNSATGASYVAGSDTQLQFNDGGTFGASSGLTFNKNSVRLGIGTSSPRTALDVTGGGSIFDGSSIATAAAYSGLSLQFGYQLATTSSVTLTPTTSLFGAYTVLSEFDMTNGSTVNAFYAVPKVVASTAGQTLNLNGVSSAVYRSYANDLATNANMRGSTVALYMQTPLGSNTTQTAYGFNATIANVKTGHTLVSGSGVEVAGIANAPITTFTGLNVNPIAGTGTISTFYGLRLQASTTPTITSRWGVSQEDGSSLNYFAGNVGIGTSVFGDSLAVNGSMSVTGSILPGASSSSNLGSSTKLWSNVYATSLTGSLTRLSDGTSYVIAGGNMTVTTGSNGAITLATINSGTIHGVSVGSGLTGGGTSGTVSIGIDNSVLATISGSTFTGAVKFNSGLSGSLTRLTDGSPYLVAGTNIGLSTGSNGSVTVNNTATGATYVAGSSTQIQFNDSNNFAASSNFVFDKVNYILSIGKSTFDGTAKLQVAGAADISGSLLPGSDNTYTLGSSAKRWSTVYGTNFYGNFFPTSGTPGSVLFLNGSGQISQSNSNFFWDSTNVRLGIGTASPAASFHVSGSATSATPVSIIQAGVATPTGKLLDIRNNNGSTVASVDYLGNISASNITAVTASFSGDLSVTGNLTVLGSSSIINSTIVSIGDNIVQLNTQSPTQSTGGLWVADTTSGETGSLIWDSSTNRWKGGLVGSETNVVLTGSTDNLYNKTLTITGTGANTISGGTQGAVGYFNTSGYLASTTAGTSGQILQSGGSSSPTWTDFGTLVSGSSVVTGSGTAGYHAKFISGRAVGNSVIYDDGTNVGIGTASPGYNLQIGTGASAGTRSLALLDSGYGIVIKGGNGNGIVQSIGTAVPLEFQAGNGNNGNYLFTSTGNVGIGTNVVGDKLGVNGSMSVTGSVLPGTDNAYNLGSSGKKWNTVYSTAFSGSLTTLANGSPYLLAGTNIQISTGSGGAITITSTASGAAYVAGSNTQVQFNDGGTFGANSGLTYNKSTGALTGTYVVASTGFSGSLTKLTDGSSYIIAGGNMSVTTGSNGAVTLSTINSGTIHGVTAGTGLTGGGTSGVVTISLSNTGSAGTYGSASQVPVFATDAQGRVTSVTNTSIQITETQVTNLSTDLGNKADKTTSISPGTGLTGGGDLSTSRTLAIDNTVVATISGSTFTGAVKFNGGLSGSLTQLSNGSSYIIGGNNISVVTGSSGAITISATGLAPSNSSYLTIGNDSSLTSERSIAMGTGLTAVDSGANGSYTIGINDSVVATISGSTFTGAVKFNGGLSGSLTNLVNGSSAFIAGGNMTLVTGSNGAVTFSTINSGTIHGVTAGTGLTGGGTSGVVTINLSSTGSAGTYGSASQVPVFATDAQGRVTSVTNTSIQIAESQVTSLTTDLSNRALTTTTITAGTGLTGGGDLSANRTLAIDNTVVATISGSTFTGAVKFNAGLSGSLTTLANGSSYLIAGNNVTISTGSSGAVTISSASPAGTVTGTGTLNSVARFTGANTIGTGVLYDDTTNVGIGTTSTGSRFFVTGSSTSTTPAVVVKAGVASPTGALLDIQDVSGNSLMYVSGSGEVSFGQSISSMQTATTTTTTTSATTLMTISSTAYRSAEFTLQGVDSTGSKFTSAKIIAIQNGSTTSYAEYGSVSLGGIAGTFSVTDPSAGSFLLQVTPSSTNSTVWKVTAILTKV